MCSSYWGACSAGWGKCEVGGGRSRSGNQDRVHKRRGENSIDPEMQDAVHSGKGSGSLPEVALELRKSLSCEREPDDMFGADEGKSVRSK